MKRTITQLVVTTESDTGPYRAKTTSTLYGLDQEGRVWQYRPPVASAQNNVVACWWPLPELPERKEP